MFRGGEEGGGNVSDSSNATAPLFTKLTCACCENTWEVAHSYSKSPEQKRLEEVAIQHFIRRVLRSEEIYMADNHVTAADLGRCSQILNSLLMCDPCINYLAESERRILKIQKEFLEKLKGKRDFSEVLADPWFDLKKYAFHKLGKSESDVIENLSLINQQIPNSSLAPISVAVDNATSSTSVVQTTSSSSNLVVVQSATAIVQPKVVVAPKDFNISDRNNQQNVGTVTPPTCQFSAPSDASQAGSPSGSSSFTDFTESISAPASIPKNPNDDEDEMESESMVIVPPTPTQQQGQGSSKKVEEKDLRTADDEKSDGSVRKKGTQAHVRKAQPRSRSNSRAKKRSASGRDVLSCVEDVDDGTDTDCTTRSEPPKNARKPTLRSRQATGSPVDAKTSNQPAKSRSPTPKRSKLQQPSPPVKPVTPLNLYVAKKSAPVPHTSPMKCLTKSTVPIISRGKVYPLKQKERVETVTKSTPELEPTGESSIIESLLDANLKVVAKNCDVPLTSPVENTNDPPKLTPKGRPIKVYRIGNRVIEDWSDSSGSD